ncbi:hypothetical protein CRENBAI_011790 [Crenichthys baileyi]|uniref:Uncharacterized protein n=1 Tax=Crenichthys baileyi TaxID=28760 RepID=A0AAV9RBG1_9TELE
MASSPCDLQLSLEQFAAEYKMGGMRISASKSEAMVLSWKRDISKVQRLVTSNKTPTNVTVMRRESVGVKECQMEKTAGECFQNPTAGSVPESKKLPDIQQARVFVSATAHANIPRNLVKALPEVGVEYIPGRGFRQMFPADPHYALGPAKSVRLSPPPADPTHHQVVISGQLSPSLHLSVQNMRPKSLFAMGDPARGIEAPDNIASRII